MRKLFMAIKASPRVQHLRTTVPPSLGQPRWCSAPLPASAEKAR
jgi:hypothetical protein